MQLFNPKTIRRHIAGAAAPDAQKLEILRQWAATIRDQSIATQSETEIEDQFKQRIVCDVLGTSHSARVANGPLHRKQPSARVRSILR